MKLEKIKRGFLILSWGLYDLANQFFALIVVSLYFVRWLTLEKGAPEIFYSVSFGVSTFLVAIIAPILGAVSDIAERRRPFLISLTLISVIFTVMLGVSKNIFVGLVFFAIANFGCQAAVVFYNALIVNISPKHKIGLISGFGSMLGYSGSILALYLIKPIVIKNGYQAAFFPAGMLFLVFALPCLIFIQDKTPNATIKLTSFFKKDKMFEMFRQLKSIFFDSSASLKLADFLKAAFFGLCVVNAVILFMSIYATKVFKLSDIQIIDIITFSSVFAILGSITSGYISDRIGAGLTLMGVFILWAVCLFFGAFVMSVKFYWAIGALVGVALGSTWAVSRALAIRFVPYEKIGEVFGLFNLVGYLSSAVGSIFWGLLLLLLSPLGELGYRIALFSLNLFLIFAFVFLLRVVKNSA